MKQKIGIVGCGPWANTVIKKIEQNDLLDLRYVICRNKNNKKKISSKYKFFKTFEDFINKHTPDSLYLAGDPNSYLEIIKKAHKKNIDCIIEKPLSLKIEDAIKIRKYQKLQKNKIYFNLPNLNDYKFIEMKKILFQRKILKINIIEGGYGPFRKKIDPILDWGIHPLSTILNLFINKKIGNISYKKILHNRRNNSKIYKLETYCHNIKIKILTGNLFKQKIRKIKIFYTNNDFIIYDFNLKKINASKNLVKKTKPIKSNNIDPLKSLLLDFTKKNILKKQLENFNTGFNSMTILLNILKKNKI